VSITKFAQKRLEGVGCPRLYAHCRGAPALT
jgi:hypothetical protein